MQCPYVSEILTVILKYLPYYLPTSQVQDSILLQAVVATILTLPIDVLKTRAMNAKPGEPTGIVTLVTRTAMEGPLAFFKGFVPSLTRMVPQTVLTFVFLEQLTQHFGIIVRIPINQNQK